MISFISFYTTITVQGMTVGTAVMFDISSVAEEALSGREPTAGKGTNCLLSIQRLALLSLYYYYIIVIIIS